MDSVLTWSTYRHCLDKSGITLPLAYRKKQLQRLYDLVKENEALLLKALHKDLRKHAVESIGGEIAPVTEECLWFLEVNWLWPNYLLWDTVLTLKHVVSKISRLLLES